MADTTLLSQIYDQLREIARRRLSQERVGHTLGATALVHEVYLKLRSGGNGASVDRAQFIITAAQAMRRILIDHARTRKRLKRGGPDGYAKRMDISGVADLTEDRDPDEIMALDEALQRLEGVDAQAARVVQLRFFAGLSVEETAEVLNVSPRTVKRDWQFARAWLFDALQ